MAKHIGECFRLVIEFEAGSDFQYDHGRSALEGIGTATAYHLRGTHRNNWCFHSIELLEPKSVSKKIKKMEEEHKRYQESYSKDK